MSQIMNLLNLKHCTGNLLNCDSSIDVDCVTKQINVKKLAHFEN